MLPLISDHHQDDLLEKSLITEQLCLNSSSILLDQNYFFYPSSPPKLINDEFHGLCTNQYSTSLVPPKPPPSSNPSSVSSINGSPKPAAKKVRHSKICTAMGLRDRRMRLSLEVARKFFDLQDLLGHDKASKTVQWLLATSKGAIEDLSINVSSSKACTPTDFSPESELCTTSSKGQKAPNSKRKGKERAIAADHKVKDKVSVVTRTSRRSKLIHSMIAKESRDKARQRARERTKEKKALCSVASTSIPQGCDINSKLEGHDILSPSLAMEFMMATDEERCCSSSKIDGEMEFSVASEYCYQNVNGPNDTISSIIQEQWGQ